MVNYNRKKQEKKSINGVIIHNIRHFNFIFRGKSDKKWINLTFYK